MRQRKTPSWLREVPAVIPNRPGLPIIELPSPNQDQRDCPVDMLILHYTGMQTAQAASVPLTLAAPVLRLRRAGFLAEEAWARLRASDDKNAFSAAAVAPIYVKTKDSPV